MTQYLIFGRPRSRTAWCANFLTSKESFCYHEPFAHHDMRDMQRAINSTPAIATGIADTSLIHRPHEVVKAFPDARLVVLTGSSLSWQRFAHRLKLSQKVIQHIEDDYQRCKEWLGERAIHIDVHQLMQNEATARRLWHHCTGRCANFDLERWIQLRDMNVQVTGESLERRLAQAITGR